MFLTFEVLDWIEEIKKEKNFLKVLKYVRSTALVSAQQKEKIYKSSEL